MRVLSRIAAVVGVVGVLAAVWNVPKAGAGGFAVVYNGQKNDGGFNEAAFNGVQKARRVLGIRVRERIADNPEMAERALHRFAQLGVTHLLTIGFANTPAVRAAAEAFPEARFTLIDGVVRAPNVKSIRFREDQAGFLAGVVAGRVTRTDHLAFLAGMSIPPIARYGCGFLQGVRAVNPDARS